MRRGLHARLPASGQMMKRRQLSRQALAELIATDCNLPQADCEQVLASLLEEVTDVLARGETLTIRNFGRFKVITRHDAKVRHMITGRPMMLPTQRWLKWRPAKYLRAAVARATKG